VGIAAFFDIDGTLISRNSAQLYMRHMRRSGQARRRDVARTFYLLALYKLGLLDMEQALAVSLEWVRGRAEEEIRADCVSWYARDVRRYLVPEVVEAIAAHRRAGHVIALLTSATRYLAEPLGADVGVEHLLVSRLVVRDGRFTGEAVRPLCYGAGKIYWAERFAAEHGLALERSFFYTDSITDLPLLERIGEPRIVNPDPRLRRVAQRRGWRVVHPRVGRESDQAVAVGE